MISFIGGLSFVVVSSLMTRGQKIRMASEWLSISKKILLVIAAVAFLMLTVGLVLFVGGDDALLRSTG